jgi:hypothetical protein
MAKTIRAIGMDESVPMDAANLPKRKELVAVATSLCLLVRQEARTISAYIDLDLFLLGIECTNPVPLYARVAFLDATLFQVP